MLILSEIVKNVFFLNWWRLVLKAPELKKRQGFIKKKSMQQKKRFKIDENPNVYLFNIFKLAVKTDF